MLLDIKPDTIYAQGQCGVTDFHYAVNNNIRYGVNIEAIRLLVHAKQYPERLNARDDLGATNLGDAIELRRSTPVGLEHIVEILEILLRNKVKTYGIAWNQTERFVEAEQFQLARFNYSIYDRPVGGVA